MLKKIPSDQVNVLFVECYYNIFVVEFQYEINRSTVTANSIHVNWIKMISSHAWDSIEYDNKKKFNYTIHDNQVELVPTQQT